MSEEIKPALTAEEWNSTWDWDDYDAASKHRAAARCLYGQPFGFSRNDLEAIDAIKQMTPSSAWWRLDSLRARIAALLPPE